MGKASDILNKIGSTNEVQKKAGWDNLVGKVGAMCDYDYATVGDFVCDVLRDCNFGSEAQMIALKWNSFYKK